MIFFPIHTNTLISLSLSPTLTHTHRAIHTLSPVYCTHSIYVCLGPIVQNLLGRHNREWSQVHHALVPSQFRTTTINTSRGSPNGTNYYWSVSNNSPQLHIAFNRGFCSIGPRCGVVVVVYILHLSDVIAGFSRNLFPIFSKNFSLSFEPFARFSTLYSSSFGFFHSFGTLSLSLPSSEVTLSI